MRLALFQPDIPQNAGALLRLAACLGVAERLLGAGERRARALGEAAGARRLAPAEVARHGDPARIFRSVNTPQDLAAAEALVRDPEGRA